MAKAKKIETQIISEVVSTDLPMVDRVENRFFLVHFPVDWKMCASGKNKGKWIPTISEIPYVEGCNGVKFSNNPGPAVAHVTNTKKRKAIQINPQDPKVGSDLIRSIDARSKNRIGKYFLTKFAIPSIDFNGNLKLEQDTEAFEDFCLGLVEKEVIPPINPDLVTVLIEQQEKIVDQLMSAYADNRPGIEKTRKRKQDLLQLMKQSVEE